MKYGDEAWTEPEPAGSEPALIDTRIIDKAYQAPPPGGWLTVGGTDDETALNDGRLPGGHAPSVPVPPTLTITDAGGAVDVPAVITLTGTFTIGTHINVVRTASAEPAPTGAPYPIRQSMDAAAVASGWASYLNLGVGYTVTASGGVMTFTPDPGETIALADLTVSADVQGVPAIVTAAGTDVDPAIIDMSYGVYYAGDMVAIDYTVGGTSGQAVYIATYTQNGMIAAAGAAAELLKVAGIDASSYNQTVEALASAVGGTVNIDGVLLTPASGTGGGGPVDPPGGGGCSDEEETE